MKRAIYYLPVCFFPGFFACAQIDLGQALKSSLCSDDFNRSDAPALGPAWQVASVSSGTMISRVEDQKARITMPGQGFGIVSCTDKVQPRNSAVSAVFVPLTAINTTLTLIARSQARETAADAY